MSMKKEKDHWYLEISIVETNKQTVDDEIEFFRFIQAINERFTKIALKGVKPVFISDVSLIHFQLYDNTNFKFKMTQLSLEENHGE